MVQPPAAQAVPVATPAPAPVDTAALERAAREKQRQDEQDRIAQARQQKINDFYSLLSQKVADLRNAQTAADSRLDDNTNKIKKASWLRRGYLRDKNNEARKLILKKLEDQQDSLQSVQDAVRAFATDANADPYPVDQTFRAYGSTADLISRDINAILQNMDDTISGHSGQSGMIQMR